MRSPDSRNRGYAFLILMLMVTVLLISLTAALPSIYTAGQREKEEELIFRGNQYARAVMLFHRQFGRYPSSIDEIAKKTNGIRFLRHAFADPMTSNGKWRLIHVDARGIPFDSRSRPIAGGTTNQIAQPSPVNPTSGGLDDNPSSLTNQTVGGFIFGVASSSRKASIRIWKDHNHYDEWEFLANGLGTSFVVPGQATPPASQGQSPGQGQGGGIGTGIGPGTTPGAGPGEPQPPDINQLPDEPSPEQ